MKSVINKMFIIMVAVLAITPVMSVSARSMDDVNENRVNTESSSSASEQTSEGEKTQTKLETEKQEIETRKSKMQEQINERSKEIEKEGPKEKKSDEKRKKLCSEKKKGVETKLSRITSNAQKHQDRISAYLDKIIVYKTEKNITSTDIDNAITAANEAKLTSAATVAALKDLSTTINCDSPTVASDLATFKAAAEQTRNNLKAFKTSVVAVHTAVEQAKQPAESEEQ